MLAMCLLFALEAAPTATPAPAPGSERRAIVGRVVSVDLEHPSMVVTESLKPAGSAKRRETVTLTVLPGTSIVRGQSATTLADVKPKDHVVVRYRITPRGALAESLRVADRTAAPSSASGAAASESSASE